MTENAPEPAPEMTGEQIAARAADLRAAAQERYEAKVIEIRADLAKFSETITQREWLLVQRALEASRDQIADDEGLTLLALAWIRNKREHGGASWDRLLDMTDADLRAEHGFPERPSREVEPVPPVEQPGPVALD